MAETLANGTVVPQGSDLIHASGVQAMRNMGGSVDAQLGNRALVGHTHPIAGVVGLQSALDGKSTTSHTHSWSQITSKPSAFPPATHTHDARYYTQTQIDTRLDAISTAYQVAQMFGFEGTAEQWLASLVGPRGPEGPYGGTEVTDPQVASYVTTETETRAALDRSYLQGVNADAYGAVGDGIADDTAAIQAAIDAAVPLGLAVSVPAGRYRITSSIDMPSQADLRLSDSTVLDISEMSGSVPAISATGTIGSPVPLSADAAPGVRAITVSDTEGLSAGGWVKITSDLPFGYTNQPAGEIHQVASVSGDTVTLVEALSDVYTVADGAAVAPVEFRENVRISGGAMEGNPDAPTTTYRGVVLDTCRNVTVTGMSFRWVHYVSVWLRDTVGATVLDCRFDDALSVGLGYGVMMSEATQNASVTACHGTRTRHFVTFGGGAARAGIVRRVTVTGCNFSQCIDAGLDAHPGAEDFAFVGNTITGSLSDGIVAQGGRFVVSNNVITGSARHGVIVQAATRKGLEGVISGNTIHGSGSDGIRLTFRAETEYHVWSGLTITGNTITDSVLQGIHLFNSDTSIAPEGVAITGNVLRRNGYHAIYLRGGKDLTVGSNIISDVPDMMEGIFLQNTPDSTIHGNVVRGGLRAYRLSGSPHCTVTGNRGAGAGTGLMSQTTAAPVVAMGNNFAGCATPMSIGGGGNITTTSDAAGAYNL